MMLCGNALALHGRDFPTQRCLQPLNFGFAAFDHLFPPNQIVKRIMPRRPRVISVAPARENPRFKRLWRWYKVSLASGGEDRRSSWFRTARFPATDALRGDHPRKEAAYGRRIIEETR